MCCEQGMLCFLPVMFHPTKLHRVSAFVGFLLLLALSVTESTAQIEFQLLTQGAIETRLKGFSTNNDARETILKQFFVESGCKQVNLTEQLVKNKLPPNLICILPGKTDRVILVGAHTDHADIGDGVVDNWSGASLLPSLFYSLSGEPRQHTFIFVGFTGEEKGMLGSEFYSAKLTKEQRLKIDAMVNFDTLGLGPTKVWATRADKTLLDALARIANSMKLPIAAVNVEKVGTTDSESFARFKIPRITIHSVTQETWTFLHSKKDAMTAIHMDDYYASYRLLAGYLAFLDSSLGPPPAAPAQKDH
jgi:hypothetical protein